MFGVTLTRVCHNCSNKVQHHTSAMYLVEGKEYTDSFYCPHCSEDLAKVDRELIRKASSEGKKVIAVMY